MTSSRRPLMLGLHITSDGAKILLALRSEYSGVSARAKTACDQGGCQTPPHPYTANFSAPTVANRFRPQDTHVHPHTRTTHHFRPPHRNKAHTRTHPTLCNKLFDLPLNNGRLTITVRGKKNVCTQRNGREIVLELIICFEKIQFPFQ